MPERIRVNLIQISFLATSGISAALMYSPFSRIGFWVWTTTFIAFLIAFIRYIPLGRIQLTLSTFVMYTFAVGGALSDYEIEHSPMIWIALTFTSFLGLFSYLLIQAWRQPGVSVANIGDLKTRTTLPKRVKTIVTILHCLPILIMAFIVLSAPGIFTLIAVAVVFVLLIVLRFLAERHTQQKSETKAAVSPMLERLSPQFFIYWAAPQNSQYQLTMWIPYFQALGIPFFVMARTQASFKQAVKAAKGTPVILVRTLGEIENYLVDSIRTVFYVNNAAKNAHMVRFSQFTHVQLLHGDSEKKTSYNPVSNMFDYLFVSGKAAKDRYALHGVEIPSEKFRFISRPQVLELEQVNDATPESVKTLLYAPTWGGDYEETSYSSLLQFEDILEPLLARNIRIIFRPHKYTRRHQNIQRAAKRIEKRLKRHAQESGIQHIIISDTNPYSLVDCINLSDALIADISGVITDYLFTGKPIGILQIRGAQEFVEPHFLLKDIVYLLRDDQSNLDEFFDDLFEDDPQREQRIQKRAYFLGGDRPEDIAFLFTDAVLEVIE